MTYPPALPKWEGGWARDDCSDFPCKATFIGEALASPPWGIAQHTRSVAEW